MSEQTMEIHRTQWKHEDLALVCGIANAGGGSLIVGGAESSRARNVRRMYRTFESIPQLTQKAFGFSCPTEPIMEGTDLCLEISIPAANEPLEYEGVYYLYTDRGNEALQRAEIEKRLFPEPEEDAAPAPKTKGKGKKGAGKAKTLPEFKERSIAAAKEIYLTNTDEYVLKILATNGRATAPKIASLLGISESTVRRSFKRLKEYGMIERIGSDKAGYWKVHR